ncbi:hypothetical protein [Thermoflavifilum thermophilum]|uniref:Uncharacterized protein n=1 Tax=Thermoflavifilum thermophilum TaxID=1393122 RepID=A0A1I7N110_9BACT|nr:hypothetical protein [Thermoflavifilum thermophilum]SFV28341.1 hypothetical protein SAMN05660895_0311 [Thermoflavifilum thermophilum]
MYRTLKITSTQKLVQETKVQIRMSHELSVYLQVVIEDYRGIVDIRYLDCTFSIIDNKGKVYHQEKLNLPEKLISQIIQLLRKSHTEEEIILHCIDEEEIKL